MMERLVRDHLDMVVGHRVDQVQAAYRRGHRTGNCADQLSLTGVRPGLQGYPVRLSRFSRRFVKSFPVLSDGFESNRAHRSRAGTRTAGHRSSRCTTRAPKARSASSTPGATASDSRHHPEALSLRKAAALLHHHRLLPDAGLSWPRDPPRGHLSGTGLVPRLPTAILSIGLMILAVLSVSSGLVLDTVTRGGREIKLLAYLSQPPVTRLYALTFGRPAMDRAAARCYPATDMNDFPSPSCRKPPMTRRRSSACTSAPSGPAASCSRPTACASMSIICSIFPSRRGSARSWWVRCGNCRSVLAIPGVDAGPSTVEPPFRSRGVGRPLMDRALKDAKAKGHRLMLLVGDEAYYSRVGFKEFRRAG